MNKTLEAMQRQPRRVRASKAHSNVKRNELEPDGVKRLPRRRNGKIRTEKLRLWIRSAGPVAYGEVGGQPDRWHSRKLKHERHQQKVRRRRIRRGEIKAEWWET